MSRVMSAVPSRPSAPHNFWLRPSAPHDSRAFRVPKRGSIRNLTPAKDETRRTVSANPGRAAYALQSTHTHTVWDQGDLRRTVPAFCAPRFLAPPTRPTLLKGKAFRVPKRGSIRNLTPAKDETRRTVSANPGRAASWRSAKNSIELGDEQLM